MNSTIPRRINQDKRQIKSIRLAPINIGVRQQTRRGQGLCIDAVLTPHVPVDEAVEGNFLDLEGKDGKLIRCSHMGGTRWTRSFSTFCFSSSRFWLANSSP